MKCLFVILLVAFLFSCSDNKENSKALGNNQQSTQNISQETIGHIRFDWQDGFGLTHSPRKDTIWGKLVSFYIENPNCHQLPIDFYNGIFRPTDSDSTTMLLALVMTDDESLRPFYRWCLDKTIQIQDGALGEYTGVPARKYAEKFPEEFFQYMDSDSSGRKYEDWVNSISYGGFYDKEDYNNPKLIQNRMEQTMKNNSKEFNSSISLRIKKFAFDCWR